MTTTKRTRLGVALFAVVNAHFSVQRACAFAVRSSARCKRSQPAMMAVDSPSLSRTQLLRTAVPVLVGVAALHSTTPAEPARAALPTTEDYAFGTGSKVRHKRYMALTGLFFFPDRLSTNKKMRSYCSFVCNDVRSPLQQCTCNLYGPCLHE